MLLSGCGLEDQNNYEVSTRHRNADIMTLAGLNGCTACHQIQQSLIGPPWKKVAERYGNNPDARNYLIQKVKFGSQGAWSDVTGGAAMPANSPRVTDEHIIKLVDFILSLNEDSGRLKLRPEPK